MTTAQPQACVAGPINEPARRLFVAETDYIPCWVWASAPARNATTDEEIAAVLIREELWLQSEVFSRVAVPRRGSQSNWGFFAV
jgi:hypothetical protein